MTVAARPIFELDDSFARELVGLHQPWQAEPAAEPSLIVLNENLAVHLGLDVDTLRSPDGIALLAGNASPAGVTTVAQAYAGHQFGGYSPSLGDGRALLLGELVGRDGVRRDLHLKGSGRTPFARGGDGRAAVGPMLREYLIGEAMHGLGIATTRMLAVVATGDTIVREVDSRHARAGCGAHPGRVEPPACGLVPVRRRDRRPRAAALARRLRDRPARPRSRRRRQPSTCTVRSRRRRAGGAGRPVDGGRLHPRGAQHRQRHDLG